MSKQTPGIGKHGSKVGRPRLVTRETVRLVCRTARERNISEKAAALALGYVPITIAVNKRRLGLTRPRNVANA
jgi:hypothetical protein